MAQHFPHCPQRVFVNLGLDLRQSDIEPLFVCQGCGRRGADVRPDWHSVEAYA
jgi:hypothetical protein